MASELIMPNMLPTEQKLPYTPQHQPHDSRQHIQRPQHVRSTSYHTPPGSQQISPLSTSGQEQQRSSMPSSPKSNNDRQGGRPMYMPAVLRPNSDFTQVSRTNTGTYSPASEHSRSRRNSNSGTFRNVPGFGVIQRLSRRSTDELAKEKELVGTLDHKLFPEVTDAPTRQHWKHDPESSICDDATCRRGFSYFVRRHHCRRCGNIFCDEHSSYEIPLDQDANYNPRGAPSRTCNHCFEEYRVWHSRNNSHSSSSVSSSNDMPVTPISAPGGPNQNLQAGLQLAKSPNVAASVPRDWSWSTF